MEGWKCREYDAPLLVGIFTKGDFDTGSSEGVSMVLLAMDGLYLQALTGNNRGGVCATNSEYSP